MNKHVHTGSQSRAFFSVSSLMHVSQRVDFYWAKDQIQIKKGMNAKMLLTVENVILWLWIKLILNPIICLFHSLCNHPVREQNAIGIVRGGTVLPGLLLCTHFKSEVMGHFRRLLLHTPNCQYTVITKGPLSSEISIATCTALKSTRLHWGCIDGKTLVETTLWFHVFWHLRFCFRQGEGVILPC